MKMQQPSLVVALLFLLFCVNISRAQTFERSWLHENSLKRYSQERRRLHRHQGEEEDQLNSSHHVYHYDHHHGRKSDQSRGNESDRGLEVHSKSQKGSPPLPRTSESSKSKKNDGPVSHSYNNKKNVGPKSQGGSKDPENGIETMECRKDDFRAAVQDRGAKDRTD
jgi:hypothetical protein